ncbi:MAG: VWA domain-containing protein [Bdellovibrionales bacterium]|nr:VWA domain-containing protein [Bdellovibrionales bacterium]
MWTTRFLRPVMLVLLLLAPASSMASFEEHSDDQTLSPYFFVNHSCDEGQELLPLKSTDVDVDIVGVIADVRVTQTYKNTGTSPLEAIYIFPGSTRAAVYGMKMTIGERVRIAKIKEKHAAKQTYEQAKKEGKSASLLEQHRPNVFKMSVANIMPGDEIKVELSYTELLIPTDGTYEFVYPTVVGPRYSNQPASTAPESDKWVSNPYLMEGEAPTSTFDLTLGLATGIPLQDLASSSHDIGISYLDKSQAQVSLKANEKNSGNRDFILRYRLEGGAIESGLMLYEGKDENFFLLMMQPPERVAEKQIAPRDYVFIVDVSGSMNGFPLNISKRLMKDLIGSLREVDTFNVMLFAGRSALLSTNSVPATTENINKALQFINSQNGGGGTELLPALQRALALPQEEGVSRSIVVATDGYVNVEPETFDLIRNNLNNANLFAFGIGSSVNRHLIEGMAHVGYGEPFVVTKPAEAPAAAARLRALITQPVLTDIDVTFAGIEVYDVEPPSVPDLLAERPIVMFGKYNGKPAGSVIVEGFQGAQPYNDSIDISKADISADFEALKYLWARHRVKTLGEYNKLRADDKRVEEITALGLQYNLLTEYTSFVAVDEEVRNPAGKQNTVKQPLPLPKGATNLAVGGIPTVPEPETYALLALVGVMLLLVAARRQNFSC